MRHRAPILSIDCATSGWSTSPPQGGSLPRRTASCFWTSKRVPRRSISSRRGPENPSTSRPGRSPMLRARRRSGSMRPPSGPLPLHGPKSRGSKRAPRSSGRGASSTWPACRSSPGKESFCVTSPLSAIPTTRCRPSGRSSTPFPKSTGPIRPCGSSWWLLPGRKSTSMRRLSPPSRPRSWRSMRNSPGLRLPASCWRLTSRRSRSGCRASRSRLRPGRRPTARWSLWRVGPRRRLPPRSTPCWRSIPTWSISRATPHLRTTPR